MARTHTLSGSAGVRFQDRRRGQCAAPLWGDAERIGLVCGRDTPEGHSYCPACAAKMTVPLPQATVDKIIAARAIPGRVTGVGYLRKGRATRSG